MFYHVLPCIPMYYYVLPCVTMCCWVSPFKECGDQLPIIILRRYSFRWSWQIQILIALILVIWVNQGGGGSSQAMFFQLLSTKLRGSLSKSVPIDFGLDKTFALYFAINITIYPNNEIAVRMRKLFILLPFPAFIAGWPLAAKICTF